MDICLKDPEVDGALVILTPQAMTDPIVFPIVDALAKECVKVARANEIELGWNFYSHAIDYMSKAGAHKPSMLMDIEARRRTEVDFINGWKIERNDPLHRIIIGRIYQYIIKFAFGLKLRDVDCDFRLMRGQGSDSTAERRTLPGPVHPLPD